MLSWIAKQLLSFNMSRLNAGDARPTLLLDAPDVQFVFPGENSWASMFRPVVKGRECHVTHRGYDECRAFAERFVANKVQFVIEDILVNGPPWHLRVALRVHDFVAGGPGELDVYNNRAVAFIELRWFKLVRWEDYEDCERVAAWDAATHATVT